MHQKIFLFVISICWVSFSFGQEDYTLDKAFFKAQEAVYQQWLEDAGLGEILKVQEVEVEPDLVSLYLAFHFTDIDSMFNAWNQLKVEFDQRNDITLEQQLFYKFIHILDIPESDGNVQVFDKYTLEKYCLYWGIYFEEGEVKSEHEHLCNKFSKTFQIDPVDFSTAKKITADSIKNRLTRSKVFDEIFRFARQRFEQPACDDRIPLVRLRENKTVLRFEADDLCREVLLDETNHVLCRIANRLRFSCNTISRERLNFTFTYEPTEEGFQLSCEIDGKYASGSFGRKPKRGDYKNMEEGTFKEYLELYADLFIQDLRQILVRL